MSQMNREDFFFFFFFKKLLHFSQIVEEKSSFLSLKEMALLSLFAKKVKSSVGETFSRSQYFTKIVKSRKSRTKAHKYGWCKFAINAKSFLIIPWFWFKQRFNDFFRGFFFSIIPLYSSYTIFHCRWLEQVQKLHQCFQL